MTAAATGRFVAVGGFLWMSEVAAQLRAALGERAAKVPRRTVPDVVLKGMARLQPGLGALAPMLGRGYTYSTDRARSLGRSPRSTATAVVDCAESLLETAGHQGWPER